MTDTLNKMSSLMRHLTWIIALVLLTIIFNNWVKHQYNPNSNLAIGQSNEPVVLERNRQGHYVATGLIEGEPVVFLLDTGATNISVPQPLAQRIGLDPGDKVRVGTANGSISVFRTELESVQLGGIEMRGVAAHINPFMEGNTVLLGMSFLKHLELRQTNGVLELRVP